MSTRLISWLAYHKAVDGISVLSCELYGLFIGITEDYFQIIYWNKDFK